MQTVSTIPAVLGRAVERFGARIALEDGAVRLDFQQLADAAERAAGALIALGVEPGDRVAIQAPNRWEWIVAALGSSLAGAAIVPINTRFKPDETAYLLNKSRARVLFSVGEFLGTRYLQQLRAAYGGPEDGRPVAQLRSLAHVVLLDGEEPGALTLEQLQARAGAREHVRERAAAVRGEHVSDIMFTSGTTGQPKGVVATHAQSVRAYGSWCEAVGLGPDDRYLIVNPFFHTFGYKAGWLACLMTGATILPHAVFDASQVLARLRSERISVLPGPPTLYQSLLAHPELQASRLPALRLAVTGAAVIPVELIERMMRELGCQTVITGYGLTESCGIATMCRAGDDVQTIATTSGRAIEGVEVRVVGPDGAALPAGEPGEIVVRGYNVMQGYFEAPADTRDAIDAAGFLHTGDIGVLDERGYLRITDRLKDMYICGGFNCYPAEIERVIAMHPDVALVAVIGTPDARLGEVGMAFVVPRAGGADQAALGAWCRERLANYKVPRRIELVDALPLNAAGKVVKPRLRALTHPG